jgi:hypothetical protein
MLVLTLSIFGLAYAPNRGENTRVSVNSAGENYRIYKQVGEGQIRIAPASGFPLDLTGR